MDGDGAAEDWLESWAGGVSARAARAVELSNRVAGLTGTAEASGGKIEVTVGSAGQLRDLRLDDASGGEELARRIMAVVRAAQADLSVRVAHEVRATVGEDTETGRAVIGSFQTRFPPADAQAASQRNGARHDW
ncbi:hypothetical protein GCM10023322_38910 [Rugosimonospora acidiphila]|uniref:YbaB/EbfC DNA-binding family protein n=1 Tax=Rugosimonospora acidiphila TaxID=556531 RepID=A0ABP9RWL6_9ACTN